MCGGDSRIFKSINMEFSDNCVSLIPDIYIFRYIIFARDNLRFSYNCYIWKFNSYMKSFIIIIGMFIRLLRTQFYIYPNSLLSYGKCKSLTAIYVRKL
jgi:hypothetical protein